MPKTYWQKIDELRLKALKTIEEGLDDPDPSMRFSNSIQFICWQTMQLVDAVMPEEPDALDLEELPDDTENKGKNS